MSELHCLTPTLESATATESHAPATHETRANPVAVAQAVERAVRRDTRRGVRDLEVQIRADGVHLRGCCSTYYCKQLAQHAAATVVNGTRLHNEIQVW